jgi:hypothetical protein
MKIKDIISVHFKIIISQSLLRLQKNSNNNKINKISYLILQVIYYNTRRINFLFLSYCTSMSLN